MDDGTKGWVDTNYSPTSFIMVSSCLMSRSYKGKSAATWENGRWNTSFQRMSEILLFRSLGVFIGGDEGNTDIRTHISLNIIFR